MWWIVRAILTVFLLYVGFIIFSALLSFLLKAALVVFLIAAAYYLYHRGTRERFSRLFGRRR